MNAPENGPGRPPERLTPPDSTPNRTRGIQAATEAHTSPDRDALTANIARAVPVSALGCCVDCPTKHREDVASDQAREIADAVMAVVWPVIEQAEQERDAYWAMWKNENVINRDLIAQRDELAGILRADIDRLVTDAAGDEPEPSYVDELLGIGSDAGADSVQRKLALRLVRARQARDALRAEVERLRGGGSIEDAARVMQESPGAEYLDTVVRASVLMNLAQVLADAGLLRVPVTAEQDDEDRAYRRAARRRTAELAAREGTDR